jgi:hypothetical protein
MKASSLDEENAIGDVITVFRITAKSVQNATRNSAFFALKQSSRPVNPSLDDSRISTYARVFGTKIAFSCLILRSIKCGTALENR